MKSPTTRLCLVGLASALLLAGCESAPARNPRTTRTVVLSPARPSPDIETGLVSAIRVVLPGPEPGSGLSWEIASNNNKVLDQMGPITVGPLPEAGDGKPMSTVSFYVLRPGRSLLRFYLLDPKLGEAVPAATCEVTVRAVDE